MKARRPAGPGHRPGPAGLRQPDNVVDLHHPAPDRRACSCCSSSAWSPSRSSSWCPGWPAAARRPGRPVRRPDRRRHGDVTAAAERLGFNDPICVQYWRLAQGHLRRRRLRLRPGVEHCPAPCFGYSFITDSRSGRSCSTGCRSRFSLALGAADHLADLRRDHRRRSPRCAAAPSSTGPRWASRSPASRCRSSSPACWRWRSSATSWTSTAPGGSYTPFTENPAEWAYDLILPWITLAFLFSAAVRPADPRRHAGDDERGLRPHRPGQGPARADRDRQARSARRAHPDRHHLRPRPRPAARRRGAHRDDVLAARARQVRDRRDHRQRPADDPGRHADRRVLRRLREPDRGPAVRRRRPDG